MEQSFSRLFAIKEREKHNQIVERTLTEGITSRLVFVYPRDILRSGKRCNDPFPTFFQRCPPEQPSRVPRHLNSTNYPHLKRDFRKSNVNKF